MGHSDRFDELFRRAFQRVRVPEPPELDWRALANASARGRDGSAALAGRIWGLSLAAGVAAIATLLFYSGSPDPRSVNAPVRRVPDLVRPEQGALVDNAIFGPTGKPEVTVVGSASASEVRSRVQAVVNPVPALSDHAKPAADRDAAASVSRKSRGTSLPGTIASYPTTNNVDPAAVDAHGPVEQRDDVRLSWLDPLFPSMTRVPGEPRVWTPVAEQLPAIPHWSVSPWVSFDQTTFSDDHASSTALNDLQLDPGITGTIGARVAYAFDERLAVYTGAQLAWKGALRGTISTSAHEYATYDLSGRYLELPFGVRFTAPKERWSLYARAGAALQLNMRPGDDHVVVYDLVAKEARTMRLASNSVGVMGELAAGLEFRVKRGLSMFIEPVYRYGFTPIMQHPSYTGFPLNPRERTVGLATGITYQFLSK